MHKFYYNECIPSISNIEEFKKLFCQTLIEFNKVRTNIEGIMPAVITEKLPSHTKIGTDFTLEDVLETIEDRILKRIAFSYFNKYPIQNYFNLTEEQINILLEKEYIYAHDETKFDATNLAIVSLNNGILFTAPVNANLTKHHLEIESSVDKKDNLSVNNLFGNSINTDFIQNFIKFSNAQRLSKLELLKYSIGNVVLSSSFEKDFLSLKSELQDSIIDCFDKAKGRGLVTNFHPDTKIIKDVTPSKAKCKIYELRVYSPVALRVYFNESSEKVYVSSVELKSNPNQSEDISKAHSLMYKMIVTE